MADGAYFVDQRAPFITADIAALTVIATNKAYVPLGNLPVLGSNYWYIGKAVRIKAQGKMSTAATPGTFTLSWFWGTGADANGTSIVASPVITPAASLTASQWWWEMMFRCRALGSSGSLIGMGRFCYVNSNTLTTSSTDFMIPGTPAATTVDLTAANVISPQILATTSTTNTITCQEFSFESMN